MSKTITFILVLIVIALGAGYYFYAKDRAGTNNAVTTKPAQVDRVKTELIEEYPPRMRVTASGNLPDSCTTVSSAETRREGNTFFITLHTTRPNEAVCAEVLTPFDRNIDIDVSGLQLGTYLLDVNGVKDSFELNLEQKL